MFDYASYFSLGDCMEGLNLIFNNLYGIELLFENINPGEVWADQVYKLAGNYLFLLLLFITSQLL